MKCFTWPVRIYYEDTDHGGVVYYANYLRYMERCRTEYLRAQGVEQDQLINNCNLLFAVRRTEVDYFAPARFNDLLLVTAHVFSASRVKFDFEQKIYRVNSSSLDSSPEFMDTDQLEKDNQLICRGVVTVASLGASDLRPKRLPEKIFEELMREH